MMRTSDVRARVTSPNLVHGLHGSCGSRGLREWLAADTTKHFRPSQPRSVARYWQTFSHETETDKAALLERAGYSPVRYF